MRMTLPRANAAFVTGRHFLASRLVCTRTVPRPVGCHDDPPPVAAGEKSPAPPEVAARHDATSLESTAPRRLATYKAWPTSTPTTIGRSTPVTARATLDFAAGKNPSPSNAQHASRGLPSYRILRSRRATDAVTPARGRSSNSPFRNS